MPANVRSIWVMPDRDDKAFLSSLIRFAQCFGTSAFAPDLTLRGMTAGLVPVGKSAPSSSGRYGLRARLLADVATESARTGKLVAIRAVGP